MSSSKGGPSKIIVAVSWLCLGACSSRISGDALILVNGEAVTTHDLERELRLDADLGAAQALEELIDQALMLQEAAKLGIQLGAQELENQIQLARAGTTQADFAATLNLRGIPYEEWREGIRRRSLCDEVVRQEIRTNIDISTQDLRDYYWEHVTLFRHSESVLLRQVLCRRRDEAEKALRELELGEPFSEVAGRYSKGAEARAGGSMGWIERKILPKKLEKAAFGLKPGKFSDIVSSAFGYHIFLCEARRSSQGLSFEEAVPELHLAVLREKEQPLYRNWLLELRRRAEIKRLKEAQKS
jgi:parvulin-like peptidyl-prolyl isomerase